MLAVHGEYINATVGLTENVVIHTVEPGRRDIVMHPIRACIGVE